MSKKNVRNYTEMNAIDVVETDGDSMNPDGEQPVVCVAESEPKRFQKARAFIGKHKSAFVKGAVLTATAIVSYSLGKRSASSDVDDDDTTLPEDAGEPIDCGDCVGCGSLDDLAEDPVE